MAEQPLFSEHWFRVKRLRPRLRAHVRLHRQMTRGEVWYVLEDASNARFHRFNAAAHRVIGLMDGRRTVHQIWEEVNTQLGDEAPVQDEVIRLLGELHQVDALQTNITPDLQELFYRGRERERQLRWGRLASPLALRLPLFDPDRFLNRSFTVVRPIYSRGFLLLWGLIVVLAGVLAIRNWQVLVDTARVDALHPANLLVLLAVYPVVKLLHELAHAYAVKREGGEVHEIGVMFLVFMPVPYVDASAATVFPDRRQRMLVGAAGIMAELFLASLALFVWLVVEPGWVARASFSVMLIGGISTLLFNGNPLLRFDGYYVFADAVDIPNLAQRANRYLAYLTQRYLLGAEAPVSPVNARGEAFWFVTYAIASFVYRLLLLVVICLFLIDTLFFVGVMLALWAFYRQLCLPVLKAIRFVMKDPSLRGHRPRALAVSGLGTALLAAFIAFVPVSSLTRFEGVIWPPDESQLVADTDGFVEAVLRPTGSRVARGDPLVRLANLQQRGEMAVRQARMNELLASFRAARASDRVRARLVQEEIAALQGEIELLQERIDGLLIRSPADGVFLLPDADDLPGQHVPQGEVLGYVVNASRAVARVLVTQQDQDRISSRVDDIELRLVGMPDRVLNGNLRRSVPQAKNQLPSKVLSVAGGGRFVPDPEAASDLVTRERLFEYEIELPLPIDQAMIGSRVHVRFDHGRETLWTQLSRRARQLLLSRLNA